VAWARLKKPPAAVQVVAEAQDTPLRARFSTPGLGVGTTDQLLPSQDSTKVLVAVLVL
jgi:hypothetical protein